MKTQTFTPKDLARAVDASESSIKRWIDQGKLRATKTAGGHRRVALADAFRFIRETGQTLVDPSALGLTSADAIDFGDEAAVRAAYLAALERGDEKATTSLVSHLHLLDQRIADVCDDPIHAAFRDLRGRCNHPSAECVVLHRGLANSLRAAQRLRELTELPPEDGPMALLADVGYEIDGLPTHLAEVVLAGLGVRCTQLGVNVPDEVLLGAVDRVNPTFLWLSAGGGNKANRPAVRATVAEVMRRAPARGVRVILSGDALPRRQEVPHADDFNPTFVGSMAELSAFAAGVLGDGVAAGGSHAARP